MEFTTHFLKKKGTFFFTLNKLVNGRRTPVPVLSQYFSLEGDFEYFRNAADSFYLFLSQKIHIFKIYEKKHCNIILRKQTPNQGLYGLTKNILSVLQTLKSSLHYFLSL